jgi:hypothetical protein
MHVDEQSRKLQYKSEERFELKMSEMNVRYR